MEAATIRISRRKSRQLVNNSIKSAEAINLVYVTNDQPGIQRLRKGRGFIYKFNGKTITDFDTIDRIRSLVLPPAWTNVWICPLDNGHLQATGLDMRGRKQYKYHPSWNILRNHTKYFHLHDFGKVLPSIRSQIEKDLSKQGIPQEKVLALVVSLMQSTCIRIGNSVYERLNGSFGLTTLKDQHVSISGSSMKFSFKGKKGVYHDISLKSRKLAKLVQACKDIPGKELFQYYSENGERRCIDSGMVNSYIKDISGGNFTAKDFRTWAGSLYALNVFKSFGIPETITEAKKKIAKGMDLVAKHLGNTRTICKKYYVHPVILELYANKNLEKYFRKQDAANCMKVDHELSEEENILMTILEGYGHATIEKNSQ